MEPIMKAAIRPALAAFALVSAMSAQDASATNATTTFAVTATVLSGCAVTATPLVFGNYSSSATSPLDATATVIAACTAGTGYTIKADPGTGTGATVAAR